MLQAQRSDGGKRSNNCDIVGILESALDSIGRIQQLVAAHVGDGDAEYGSGSSTPSVKSDMRLLKHRSERLKETLVMLQTSCHAPRLEHEIRRVTTTLQRGAGLLNQFHMTTMGPSTIRAVEKRLHEIHLALHEDTIDLCLGLHAKIPLEDEEMEDQERDNPNVGMFPPRLHQIVLPVYMMTERTAIHNNHEPYDDDDDETASTASLSQGDLGWDNDDNNDDDDDERRRRQVPNHVPWDFGPVATTTNTILGMGSSSSSSSSGSDFSFASRRDCQMHYARIQALRMLDQDTAVTQIRVCLAQLDPGDTTPVVQQLGRALATCVVAPVYGVTAGILFGTRALITGRDCLGQPSQGPWHDARWGAKAAFQYVQNSFLHYMLEMDLESPSSSSIITCTLERCVDDVHLYQGASSRPNKKCVFYVNLGATQTSSNETMNTTQLPTTTTSSLPSPRNVCLRDLIRYRNEQRQYPYGLTNGKNCKDFVWKFLLRTFEMEAPSQFSFSSSCQTIYGSNWPPSNLAETLAVLLQASTLSAAAAAPSTTDTLAPDVEEDHELYRVSDNDRIMSSLLQRKRVNLWASSFRENEKSG